MIEEILDEIENMRRIVGHLHALETLTGKVKKLGEQHAAEIEKLKAENDRLRERLDDPGYGL